MLKRSVNSDMSGKKKEINIKIRKGNKMLKSIINPCMSRFIVNISGKKGRTLAKTMILVLGMILFFSSMIFAGPNENASIVFDLDATTYGNQNLTIIPSQPVGTYIRIDVYCTEVQNLDTYELEVIYDPTELVYVSAFATNPITFEPNILTTNGGTALGWMVDASTPGVLSIAYTLAGTDTLEAPEGEGLIADIVFQVLSTVGDSLTFGEVYFFDSFGLMDILTDKGIAIILGAVSIDDNGFDTTFEETKLENYPNPVKSYTTIAYAIKGIKKADEVEIKIYNIVGQLVDTIEGRNGIAVCELGDFPNGIYLYKIETMDKTFVKKMLLLR